ncbi:MBL fold metallo-hydrolase [Anaerosacchariphilus polymeriproducens]|uniref:MBL fold metallo-hydrolase n=1 Tax=Anaerosacchariphilus polymeriproducens TaxID=1812858 RepID=A0A371AZN9_9FIRM|nr:MBL fold metallo-hydrolase [Anaerosacchariphilus polymeriproducens]RDU25064.1 MBL fold metallo-hydrolase [Anaerosacchariphilus polymeriproducens]
MKIQLIRHATHLIYYNGKKILVDPMFSQANTLAPIKNVPNHTLNPLVPLPLSLESLTDCDMILLTHTHRDHFDEAAILALPKDKPMLCQTEDVKKLRSHNFTKIHEIKETFSFEGIEFIRTKAKHGHGAIGATMGPSSGFILKSANEPAVYITGDTVFFPCISEIITLHQPKVIVGYCGEAKFSLGRAITLSTNDIMKICKLMTNSIFCAIHMEAWNHCRLTREDLKKAVLNEGYQEFIWIPENGDFRVFD